MDSLVPNNHRSFSRLIIGWLITLIVAKIYLIIILPYPNGDGIWFSSHSFSILRGEFFTNSFSYSYTKTYNLPYLYSLAITPFFWLMKNGGYSLHIIHLILLGLFMWMSFRFLSRRRSFVTSLAFCLLLFTNTYSYALRPELFNAVIIAFGLLCLMNEKYSIVKRIIIVGFCSAIAGISHPVGGIYAVIFFIYVLWNEGFLTKGRFLLFGAIVTVLAALLYLPVVFKDFTEWKLNFLVRGVENDNHTINLVKVAKFLALSSCMLAFFALQLICSRWKNVLLEVGGAVFFCMLLGLFGKSYYLYYLLIFFLYRVGSMKNIDEISTSIFNVKWKNLLVSVVLLFAPVFTHYFYVYQLLNLPGYASEYREILKETKQIFNQSNHKQLIWVSPDVSLPVMQQPNGRMYTPNLVNIVGRKIEISKGDVIVANNERMFKILPSMFNITSSQMDTLVIRPFERSISNIVSDGNAGKIGLVKLTKR